MGTSVLLQSSQHSKTCIAVIIAHHDEGFFGSTLAIQKERVAGQTENSSIWLKKNHLKKRQPDGELTAFK